MKYCLKGYSHLRRWEGSKGESREQPSPLCQAFAFPAAELCICCCSLSAAHSCSSLFFFFFPPYSLFRHLIFVPTPLFSPPPVIFPLECRVRIGVAVSSFPDVSRHSYSERVSPNFEVSEEGKKWICAISAAEFLHFEVFVQSNCAQHSEKKSQEEKKEEFERMTRWLDQRKNNRVWSLISDRGHSPFLTI